jgi:hypothetical protein
MAKKPTPLKPSLEAQLTGHSYNIPVLRISGYRLRGRDVATRIPVYDWEWLIKQPTLLKKESE